MGLHKSTFDAVVGLVLPQREVCGSNPSWCANFVEKQYNYIVQNYKYIGNYHMPARSPVVQLPPL